MTVAYDESKKKGSTNKWKDRLLSSSFPLEHQVADMFTTEGFATLGEFAYERRIGQETKEFSVDLWITGSPPISQAEPSAFGTTELLVECKYRMPKVRWLFASDPNFGGNSEILLGATYRNVADFSMYRIELEHAITFEESLDYAYKGVEIDLAKQEVTDHDLKHGIDQLRYALPDVVARLIWLNSLADDEHNGPFSFIPVLVTNAPLILAHPGFSIGTVQQAVDVSDLGREVGFLVITTAVTPQFEQHAKRRLKHLLELFDEDRYAAIATLRKSYKDLSSPDQLIYDLTNGDSGLFDNYFGHVVICNLASCKDLIGRLKQISTDTFSSRIRLQQAMVRGGDNLK